MIFEEPRIDNPPWTGDLADAFQAEKGYDNRDGLPAIFGGRRGDGPGPHPLLRLVVAEVAEAFFGQIQEWSARNGLWSSRTFERRALRERPSMTPNG